MAQIEITDAEKSFIREDETELLVFEDLDFVVEHEKFTCLLGPSGCGKSTILNSIAGLVNLDEGDVFFDTGPDGEADISYVFQEPRLLNWKTVKENIEFGMKGMGIPQSEWDDRVERYLDFVHLSGFEDRHPLYLSGGQRQRVAIARALAVEPDVLLMDEPFSALDEITARDLREDLLDISEQLQQTILFVTHNAMEAAFLSDRVAIMTQRPAEITAVLENPLAYPRDLEDPDLLEFEQRIVSELGV
jgi:ABC-type nitrate/sulfonate/bicarbonate transport system ATPase subunit